MRSNSSPPLARRLTRIAVMAAAAAGIIAITPNTARADERSWYYIRGDFSDGILFASYSVGSPATSFEFTRDNFYNPMKDIFESYEASQLMDATGVLGAHPANGALEEITVSITGAASNAPKDVHLKWRTEVVGTVSVTDDGNGTGTVVGDMGPTGDTAGQNTSGQNCFYDEIQLGATPNDGFVFDRWVDLSGDAEFLSEEDATNPNARLRVTRPDAFYTNPLSVSVKATFKEAPPTDDPSGDPAGTDDATDSETDGKGTDTTSNETGDSTKASTDPRDLPATGDATTIFATGTLAIAGGALAYTRNRRR